MDETCPICGGALQTREERENGLHRSHIEPQLNLQDKLYLAAIEEDD